MNVRVVLVMLGLLSGGCFNSSVPARVAVEGVMKDQIVPTLEAIARTGDYEQVLTSLTVGLESEGYMEEAVIVQDFQSQPPEVVKKTAGRLVKVIQKRQAATKNS